jgi:hypothetical protein
MLLKKLRMHYTLWEGKVCYFVHKGCSLGQMYPVRILVHFCKTNPNVALLPKPVSHRISLSFTPCSEKYCVFLVVSLRVTFPAHITPLTLLP